MKDGVSAAAKLSGSNLAHTLLCNFGALSSFTIFQIFVSPRIRKYVFVAILLIWIRRN